MDLSQQNLFALLCSIPALVAGLTVHEFAHAWAADKLGDPTPRSQGRLTLDPIVHIDPIGALFFVISSLVGFGLGWAKPVMTNPRNLKHPRRDSLLIAIAGPISNLMQLPIWFLLVFVMGFVMAKMGTNPTVATNASTIVSLLIQVVIAGVTVNVSLAAFNMIPIPPLDGHWVLQALGGRPIEELFDLIRPYSFVALILIINFTPLLQIVLGPAYSWAGGLASDAFGSGIRLGLR